MNLDLHKGSLQGVEFCPPNTVPVAHTHILEPSSGQSLCSPLKCSVPGFHCLHFSRHSRLPNPHQNSPLNSSFSMLQLFCPTSPNLSTPQSRNSPATPSGSPQQQPHFSVPISVLRYFPGAMRRNSNKCNVREEVKAAGT